MSPESELTDATQVDSVETRPLSERVSLPPQPVTVVADGVLTLESQVIAAPTSACEQPQTRTK